MNRIDAIRAMQDYIETHLDEKISLGTLAKVSFYSPWHAYRLFTEHLGLTPSDYIRKLKLSKSALELRDGNKTILSIAYQYGYESVDGYQRAFFKEFGVNPKQYADHPVPIGLFIPYKIYSQRKKSIMETKTIFMSVVHKPARKVMMKRGIRGDNYWDYSLEVGCDVWGILKSIPSLSGEPVCYWLPKKFILPNTSSYVQGVELAIDDETPIPEGFDVVSFPAADFLMFQGEPFEEEDYEQAIGQIWKAKEKYDPSVLGYAWDDDNPRIQLEPIGQRGYIELYPIKQKTRI